MAFDGLESMRVSAVGVIDEIEAIPVFDTSQLADGDVATDTLEVSEFFHAAGGMVEVHGLTVIDLSDQGQAMDVVFMRSNVSLGTKNSAPNISDTDGLEIIGRVPVGSGDFYDFGAFRRAYVQVPCLKLKAAASSRSLFVSVVSRGTGTYAAAGVRLRIAAAR